MRTILVLAPVSSTNTSFVGSRLAWRAFQRSRARDTSGRSCSAPCSVSLTRTMPVGVAFGRPPQGRFRKIRGQSTQRRGTNGMSSRQWRIRLPASLGIVLQETTAAATDLETGGDNSDLYDRRL